MRVLSPESKPSICAGFEEILCDLDNLFDRGWQDCRSAIAAAMVRLRANGTALRHLVACAATAGRVPPLQGAQSFLLADRRDYAMRINLWFPQTQMARVNDRYRRYLSINELHNHDFDFFSVCLSGPGYSSRFYRDDAFDPDCEAGAVLPLGTAATVRLAGDDVLFVEKEKDYHAQCWPEDFTTTLNLIPRAAPARRVQYVVDPANFTIRDVIRG